MTTKTKKARVGKELDRVTHHLALASTYVAAARRGVEDDDGMWAAAELGHAVRALRDGATAGADALDVMMARRRK